MNSTPARSDASQRTYVNRDRICEKYGFSKATLKRKIKDGTFPKPIVFGPRLHRWEENSTDAIVARVGFEAV